MIRRIVCHAVVGLGLVISAMLASDCSFAQAQEQEPLPMPQTPQLIFSTYLGGSLACATCPGRTFAQNAASDAQGNTYVTGATESSTLPVLNAFQPHPAPHSGMTAFVAKYDPAGRVLWLTYLGGNKQTMGVGAAAMPDGGVAVGGMTSSDGSGSESFPTRNAFQDHNNGVSNYFVTVFDANGNLRYSTYLGGSGDDGSGFSDDNSNGNNVAVDAHGLVYITGTTGPGSNAVIKFPVTPNALQPDLKGPTDAFLCILDPAKSGADSLIYCSFLGGSGNEKGHSIAVNAAGDLITAAGYTDSDDFPTTPNAYRSHYAPGFTSNGFVAQFRSSRPGDPSSEYTARYSTYLGGDSKKDRDDLYGMVMDANGLIIATGRTQSADFPMTGPGTPFLFNSAPYLGHGESNDQPYLVKIDPSLDGKPSLVYSTFLGGGYKGYGSFCTSVGVDSRGKAYVGGETNAPGVLYTPFSPSSAMVLSPTYFPYTADALITSLQGEEDVEFMQVTADGKQLGYSTYLGGTGTDRAYGLAVDPDGNVVVTGLTSSSDFPLKNPAQTWPGNNVENAFIAKFSFSLP
ncbi:MAG: SBBP repeat-containing protein [Candidatus Korobacteraceae bacterium]|jgi:hypothetical protein